MHTDTSYAGLSARAKAFGLDYLIILGYIAVLTAITWAVIGAAGLLGFTLKWPENPFIADLMAFALLILPVILYFSLLESSQRQATWGKQKMGLRVVDAEGYAITKKRAFSRSVLKLLPWQLAHTTIFQMGGFSTAPVHTSPWIIAGFLIAYSMLGIYVATLHYSNAHRSLYDRLTNVFVIQTVSKEGKGF